MYAKWFNLKEIREMFVVQIMHHWALILMFLLQIWVSYEAPKHIHDINFEEKTKKRFSL